MHSFWNFFLSRRQFSLLLIGALVALGCYCLIIIPKESTPEVIIPVGIVTTIYPGASATDVEKLVTNKLEDSVSTIDGIDKLTSISVDGVSTISVQFVANADIQTSLQDLKDAVSKVRGDLPTDAKDPLVNKVNFSDQPVLIISLSGDLSPNDFTKLADDVETELLRVSGVSKVLKSGVRAREVQVVLKKDALVQYGLSVPAVLQALAANNAALPVGSITSDEVQYAVKFKGEIADPSEVADLPVGTHGGQPVYVRDVATVVDGLVPESSISRTSEHGAPAASSVALSIYKKSGGDITAITNNIKKRLAELQKSKLQGISTVVSFDSGANVRKNLTELTRSGVETVALVIIALLLTIGWRESLVAGLSIPLSFLIAFIGLYMSGNTINFISLFSLILAVGILVDSGIVVTEAIHARMRLYPTPEDAARASLREYAWPLIGGTMTTVAVFAPLFFLSGIVGKFIASIPFTIISVLLASIFVALGLVPLIAVALTKGAHEKRSRLEEIQEEYTERVTEWYKTHLRQWLHNTRWQRLFLRGLAGLFVLSLSLPALGLIKTEFFPQDDADTVYVDIEQKQATPLEQTDISARTVEEVLYDEPDIDSFVTTVGNSSAFTSNKSGSKYAGITVNLKSNRKQTSSQIVEKLRKDLALIQNVDVRVSQAKNGPPTGAAIAIKLTGENLDELSTAADKVAGLLATIPGAIDVISPTQDNGTEFVLHVDKAKVAAAGLSPVSVAQVLRAAINGTTATVIKKDGTDINVVVKVNLNPLFTDPAHTADTSIDSIKNLTISTGNGSVLLGSVLTPELGVSNARITHENKHRIQTVTAGLGAGANAGVVTAAFMSKVATLKLPSSVAVTTGGDTEETNKSFSDMLVALVVGLALMMAILVLTFNSFRHAGQLLLIVPLSLIGVLDGLALTGNTLSFTAMLGFIALGGVIINHAIILMDSMLVHMEAAPDKSVEDVVIEAAASRLRPILLTTITTVVGMIPLSRASATWAPLAYSIMFGLSFAMTLTLILVPVLFYRSESKKLLNKHN